MTDIFDLLGDLDPFGRFEYSADQWAYIKAVIEKKIGRNADDVSIVVLDTAVPLRTCLEVEIGLYQFKQEFAERYPLRTAKQILRPLEHVQRLLRELHRALKTPEVALYAFDWGNDRGGPKATLLFVERRIREVDMRVAWLSRLFPNEPYPGPAAPRDAAPAEGWQAHHRKLAEDPYGDLVDALVVTFEEAFTLKASITENGPAFEFLRSVLRPVLGDLTDGCIRYRLRCKR